MKCSNKSESNMLATRGQFPKQICTLSPAGIPCPPTLLHGGTEMTAKSLPGAANECTNVAAAVDWFRSLRASQACFVTSKLKTPTYPGMHALRARLEIIEHPPRTFTIEESTATDR
jgi:hypothetical protein